MCFCVVSAKKCVNDFDMSTAPQSANPVNSAARGNSPEVLYITMALIGLLAVCVFVIAGLVLVVAKRRREAGAIAYIHGVS